MPRSADTQVVIVGAGPAGLLLGRLLDRHGVDNVILEARSRDYCEARIRAGVLEQGTRELLIEAGVGARMEREGLVHGGIYLRFDGESHHISMDKLTGGRCVTVYGQTEVVKDLINARLADGGSLEFDCGEVEILDVDTPRVSYRHGGASRELTAEVIAGCDGFHGVCRQAIPADVLRVWERVYPYAWLGILADVAPSTDELIYARHENGFALHSMRSPSVSRLYLQVDPDEDIAAWSDARIWEELQARLGVDGWSLHEGPVRDKSITPMRSFVAAPMRHGSLFLAGDAAHIVPPTGAKGLNLAAADVAVLAEALVDHLTTGSTAGLDGYSDRCLRRVWRAQHFSWWMTSMLHVDAGDDAYGAELQRSQLRYVCTSTAAAASLAENYVGLPFERAPDLALPTHPTVPKSRRSYRSRRAARRSRLIRWAIVSAIAVVIQMMIVAGMTVPAPLTWRPGTISVTMISAMIVEARASRPARAIEGWRTRTRRAMNCTMMWTTQKSRVASTRAAAEILNLLSTAEHSSSPTAIPTSDAPSLMPHRLSIARVYVRVRLEPGCALSKR